MKRKLRNTMTQWMSLHGQNSGVINQTRLPLLCERSGTILLSASGSYGSSAGRQSDEILVDLESLLIASLGFSHR